MSREQLESIAAELGISPEALQTAEDDWEQEQYLAEERDAFVATRRRGFRRGLAVYAAINVVLFLMAAMSGSDEALAMFLVVLLGSTVGLGAYAFHALRRGGDDFENRFSQWLIERKAREIASQTLSNPELSQWRVHSRAMQLAAKEMKRKPPRL